MAVLSVLIFPSSTIAGSSGVESRPTRAALPRNISFDKAVHLEEYLAGSPTLRRQFEVIGAAAVTVAIRVSPIGLPEFRRAETSMGRYSLGRIKAQVTVPPGPDFLELLAHELEHVVEQIEGVDLAALARTGAATRTSRGTYETVRAHEAGRAAASEWRAAVSATRRTD
jgi:hypothetical protein